MKPPASCRQSVRREFVFSVITSSNAAFLTKKTGLAVGNRQSVRREFVFSAITPSNAAFLTKKTGLDVCNRRSVRREFVHLRTRHLHAETEGRLAHLSRESGKESHESGTF